jgi:uncharacterized membrane protein
VNAGAFAASFFASAVEAIEMVAIVIGIGAIRSWRSSLIGAGAGLVVLLAISAGLGTALTAIPIDVLRLVVGALLLTLGLQWLAKGIRRVAAKGLAGDEEHVEAEGDVAREGIDWPTFVISFKGVLLEGLEIAFIVVTFGATSHNLTLAAAGGASAFVLLVIAGAVFHRVLNRIPRSLLILVVGVMLSSFGSFWSIEGVGASWPGGEAALGVLVAVFAAFAFALVTIRRRERLAVAVEEAG